MDITEVPHMGTLEMVVSPTALVDGQALYGTEGTAPHSVRLRRLPGCIHILSS
jgi:hypothetical protein